ncbi:hypothetical protein [Achromobacter animicus]|uniref:hypothetical protein n=1 Tax=Achromobacter animicus TaxID=1389935 RepID=UPI0014675A7A|nr:hypothetical protein [Achromobacter animicus]CAB3851017.1 hypothetical protein LMG26691_01984 [Achromobacter animicus]
MLLIPLWEQSDDDEDPLWRFYSIAGEDDSCPVVDALSNLVAEDGTLATHVVNMLAFIGEVTKHDEGPKLYHGVTSVCHEAVSGEQIYSFRKGPLRLYWFYGKDRRVVVCPCVTVKNEKKTNKALATKLIELRDEYEKDHKEGALKIRPRPD